MVEIGTQSVIEGGGVDITLSNMREGRENLNPFIVRQSNPH